ncbi:chemotaxis protein CheW [Sporomusa acidovorans]|uniref:Chemotaxis protein CheW n=1 Tax=Sporomusa acidovorans (strain ATCC 49682 / DSM 3132 / Mol) TaxID=1123286 RepID=A0ABZ3J8H7_SPOA4|nr:chemotaxis protein CheW [Sporomusa acidovorans]OZC16639.1 chemotaxis protein CheW [Sporomusa acidovorans DSM 3132]SDE07514.1 purine-binding chemotaxis protein CheW [Sporomusa acidovorans]
MADADNLEMEIADSQQDKYLTFVLDGEYYGIEIRHVIEIIGGIQAITTVPELPAYVKGIINLRGKIIPVMDVRLRFKKAAQEYTDRTCIIVIDLREVTVGLIVDTVAEVTVIPADDIVLPPAGAKGSQNKYIKGIGKVGGQVRLLLDCDQLLSQDETDSLPLA